MADKLIISLLNIKKQLKSVTGCFKFYWISFAHIPHDGYSFFVDKFTECTATLEEVSERLRVNKDQEKKRCDQAKRKMGELKEQITLFKKEVDLMTTMALMAVTAIVDPVGCFCFLLVMSFLLIL